jgi:uncharacterized protein YciI
LARFVNAILFYEYVPGITELRAPHRQAHLALLRDLHAKGECLLAGATGDPVHGAMIVFRSPEVAERFLREDPYVKARLVAAHRVEPITVAVPAEHRPA